MLNYKKIKNLLAKMEKKQKELTIYKGKISKLEKEIKQLEDELTNLMQNKTNNQQQATIATFNSTN